MSIQTYKKRIYLENGILKVKWLPEKLNEYNHNGGYLIG